MDRIMRVILVALLFASPATAADYYTASGDPTTGSALSSSILRTEYSAIATGFTKIAGYTGNGTRIIFINAGGTAQSTDSAFTYNATTDVLTVNTSTFGLNTSILGTLGVTGVATLTAQPILSSLTASQAVFTDGSKGLVSNAITGTGSVVMSSGATVTNLAGTLNSPTGTLGAITAGGTLTLSSNLNWVSDGAGDIGLIASARPRDVFINRNLRWDGTAIASGATPLTFSNAAPIVSSTGGTLYFDHKGITWRNYDTAGTVMTLGQTGGLAVTGTLSATGTTTAPTFDRASAAALTIGGTATSLVIGAATVTPASSGTRYLCISTAGVVTSSASACSGT